MNAGVRSLSSFSSMDPNSNLAKQMERLELNPSKRSITDAFLENVAMSRRRTTASTRLEYARAKNKGSELELSCCSLLHVVRGDKGSGAR